MYLKVSKGPYHNYLYEAEQIDITRLKLEMLEDLTKVSEFIHKNTFLDYTAHIGTPTEDEWKKIETNDEVVEVLFFKLCPTTKADPEVGLFVAESTAFLMNEEGQTIDSYSASIDANLEPDFEPISKIR